MGNDNPNTWLQDINFVVADFVLSGRRAPSVHGLYFNKLSGWHGLPDMKGSMYPNPVSHGSVPRTPDQSRRASRIITIEGSVIGTDYADFTAKRHAFITQLSREDSTIVGELVPMSGVQTYITASVVSAVFAEDHGKPACKFSLTLEAPDPMKSTDYTLFTSISDAGTEIARYDTLTYPDGGALSIIIPSEQAWSDPIHGHLAGSTFVTIRTTEGSGEYRETDFTVASNGFNSDSSLIHIDPENRRVYRDSGNPIKFTMNEWPSLPPTKAAGTDTVVRVFGNSLMGPTMVARWFKVW